MLSETVSVLSQTPAPKPAGRRAQQKEKKLERILRAAEGLFRERGFEATTTRAIAHRARIAAGTLFLYFPEKLDILLALFRRDIGPIAATACAAVDPALPFAAQVLAAFAPLFDHYARDERLARAFVKELMFLEGERRVAMAMLTLDYLAGLGTLVGRAQARGEIAPDIEPLSLAQALFGTYYVALVGWLGGMIPGREALDAQLAATLSLVLRGSARTT